MKNRIPFENGKSALRKSVPIDGSLGLMKITDGATVKGHPSARTNRVRERTLAKKSKSTCWQMLPR
jgi:hypothetical protein